MTWFRFWPIAKWPTGKLRHRVGFGKRLVLQIEIEKIYEGGESRLIWRDARVEDMSLYRGPQSLKAAWVGVRACDLGPLSEFALLRRALPCALIPENTENTRVLRDTLKHAVLEQCVVERSGIKLPAHQVVLGEPPGL